MFSGSETHFKQNGVFFYSYILNINSSAFYKVHGDAALFKLGCNTVNCNFSYERPIRGLNQFKFKIRQVSPVI